MAVMKELRNRFNTDDWMTYDQLVLQDLRDTKALSTSLIFYRLKQIGMGQIIGMYILARPRCVFSLEFTIDML